MDDLIWGLQMAAVGMGVVFALLIGLMLILLLLGHLDPQPESEPHALEGAFDDDEETDREDGSSDEPQALGAGVHIDADGLDADAVAAITVAVLTHREVRRNEAAPAMRSHQPGSHLYASRWVAVGRGQQSTRRGR